jgi:hypothetical protein
MNSLTTTNPISSSAVEVLPDSDRFKCRFKVRSASSNQLYLVSYDAPAGWWTCSCRGNIRHGSCKHLEAAGLKGRKYGKSRLEDSPIYKKIASSSIKEIAHA